MLISHAIYGLGRTVVSFTASTIWSSALLTSGSLQQNITDVAINKWSKLLTAYMPADWQHFEHFLWASHDSKKNHV